ncbi:MAG: hypothetical protein HQK55_01160 [Deltaproteobacteria bacterium]|nr:hypothetical protein [Deltaproteobacteria bacterium]
MNRTESAFNERPSNSNDLKPSKLKQFFSRPAAWVLVAVIGLAAFCWPFWTGKEPWSARSVYIYYFVCWAVLILILALIGAGFSGKNERAAGPMEE